MSFINKLLTKTTFYRYNSTILSKRFSSSQPSLQSSLYVSAKYGQELSRVLNPTYDVNYINHILENLDTIEQSFRIRNIENHHDYFNDKNKLSKLLNDFIQHLTATESLKKKRNRLLGKMKKSTNNENLQEKYQQFQSNLVETREMLFALEEKIVPFLLSIPCEIEPSIRDEPKIIDRWQSNTSGIGQNYVRLGYLNNLYTRSIVGPGANYLHGQGALLYYGLIDMFSHSLNESGYILVNGLDLVKSALIECVNYRTYYEDPYRLRLASNQSEINQRLHLVGDGSLESFCAWLSKQDIDRGHFYQIGSTYNHHSDRIEQNHIIRATILSDPRESSKAMNELYQ
ncbi:serine-tRNA ligase-like protein, partial [Euroglyphus maynei]